MKLYEQMKIIWKAYGNNMKSYENNDIYQNNMKSYKNNVK